MIPCKFCGVLTKKKNVLKHLERDHYANESDQESRFYIRCGDCSCCFSDDEAYSMVEHCISTGHEATKLTMNFSEIIRSRTDQMRKLIISGIDIIKDARNIRSKSLTENHQNPVNGALSNLSTNNVLRIESAAMKPSRVKKRPKKSELKRHAGLSSTQPLSNSRGRNAANLSQHEIFTKPIVRPVDHPTLNSMQSYEESGIENWKPPKHKKPKKSSQSRNIPRHVSSKDDMETTISEPYSSSHVASFRCPVSRIKTLSPSRHDTNGPPSILGDQQSGAELEDTEIQRECTEIKSEPEVDKPATPPPPPPPEPDLLDGLLEMSHIEADFDLYNSLNESLTLEKIEEKNPATIPLARLSLTDSLKEFQENLQILESLPELVEESILDSTNADVSKICSGDITNISMAQDFDGSVLSVQSIASRYTSSRVRHTMQVRRAKAPRKGIQLPYKGPELECTMCDYVAVGRCFSGSRVVAFTHGLSHTGIYLFQCADCGCRKVDRRSMQTHISSKRVECRSFLDITTEAKIDKLRDTLNQAFPTVEWDKFTCPGMTYRGILF